LDAFILPQPFLSWILDEEKGRWNSPVPEPTDGKSYTWNEKNKDWKIIQA